jgi:hypothetical protein
MRWVVVVRAERAVRVWAVRGALAVLASVVVCVASSAKASVLRQLVPSVAKFVSDGARYAAWQVQRGSPIVVLDTETGQEKEIPAPVGCGLEEEQHGVHGWQATAGRFLLTCVGGEWRLLDVRTAGVTVLPRKTGHFESGWDSVGTRYAEGNTGGHACARSGSEAKRGLECITVYDIATTAVTYRPQSVVPDLNRAGAPPICARLRKTVILEREFGDVNGESAYSDGILAEAFGDAGDVQIRRCNGKRTVLGARGGPEYLDPRGGILSWDSGHPSLDFDGEGVLRRGTLFSYSFAARKRRSWALPRLPLYFQGEPKPHASGVFGYSTHTKTMVFWVASRSVEPDTVPLLETSYVYAARLR